MDRIGSEMNSHLNKLGKIGSNMCTDPTASDLHKVYPDFNHNPSHEPNPNPNLRPYPSLNLKPNPNPNLTPTLTLTLTLLRGRP